MKALLAIILTAACVCASAGAEVEYVTDVRHRIVHPGMGWGMLGIDTCAHAPGVAPLPMRIGDKTYARGLGHHAPGELVIDLEGMYDRFEAEVGVQKQESNVGSVVFQVFVDGEKRFDSGVMRESDAARPISIPVNGASELRLVALDAGDGMACDCANWAEARMVVSSNPRPVARKDYADVAPFARVVAFDPKRMDGSRANRVQEFHADDLFLDTPLYMQIDEAYRPPVTDGPACIGLQWIERRCLREVGIEFAAGQLVPSSEDARLEAWVGESPWQGGWRPVNGKVIRAGNAISLKIDRFESPEIVTGTWKVRWIFPSGPKPLAVTRLTAYTGAQWETIQVRLECEQSKSPHGVTVEMYDGWIERGRSLERMAFFGAETPVSIPIRYLKTRSWMVDRTVIGIHLPKESFGIAVEDLLAHKSVYVAEHGIFATIDPSPTAFADYKKEIEGRKTILRQVREMPDQTFAQAMAKTHNPIQDNGPTMLSLACDNHKFVVEQDGSIRFALPGVESNPAGGDLRELTCLMRLRFGGKDLGRPERYLGGNEWLPALATTFHDGKVSYTELNFVAPHDKVADPAPWPHLNREPLMVGRFTVTNNGSEPADVGVSLEFSADANGKAAQITMADGRYLAQDEGRLLAVVEPYEISPLAVRSEGGSVRVNGNLPARSGARFAVYIPAWKLSADQYDRIRGMAPPPRKQERPGGGPDSLLEEFRRHWTKVLAPAMSVKVPESLLGDVIRASQVHCLMAARNEEEGKRIAPWISSDRYGPLESEAHSIIRGMMLFGHQDFARKSLDFFIKRYSPEGFLTTGYTLMGTGLHLQTLGEYFDLTDDREWMKGVAPEVERVCRWISAQRAKTKALDELKQRRPEYGLMPPGVCADWNAFAYHFALNGYYQAGLESASRALMTIDNPAGKDLWEDASQFARDIRRAFEWTQARTPVVPLRDGTWVQAYPGRLYCPGPTGRFFPGEDANRSWCYDVELGAHHLVPQGVIHPNEESVSRMKEHMEDAQFLADGWFDYPREKNEADWFNLGGFSKVQPYYTRNAEIYAMTGDVKPFIRSYFNSLASLLNTENLSLWEHFHNVGGWNKTHETGYFLQQTRWMFVTDRRGPLWLAPFIPERWLEDGKVVEVRNAPTRFGKVSYRIESNIARGHIAATLDIPRHHDLSEVALRLRHPEGKTPTKVTIQGGRAARWDAEQSAVRLTDPPFGKTTVVVEY